MAQIPLVVGVFLAYALGWALYEAHRHHAEADRMKRELEIYRKGVHGRLARRTLDRRWPREAHGGANGRGADDVYDHRHK